MERLVLIVDDNPDDRESLVRMLRKVEGATYRYIEAADGLKGVEMVSQHRPDCMLLDYSLPGHNGLEILKRLRPADQFLPVIMLTGQGNEAIAVQAMKEGAQDYLVKSAITPELLHRTVSSAVDHMVLKHSLQEQADELKYINGELETFTYIASHDMRSPLVSLKGFSGELNRALKIVASHIEGLLAGLPEADSKIVQEELCQRIPKALGYISAAADKIDRLSGSILKLSRLGRQEIAFEPIETRTMVDQCLASLAHQIEKTKTTVEMSELPNITADRASLEQVFGNLLDNALKYIDPSRPGNIRIEGKKNGTYTSFSVIDNGRGIAEDDLHKVFEIFRRAGDVENIPGEGMGIPYVRAIVRRHQGRIWVESTPDKGTSVHFTISNQAA